MPKTRKPISYALKRSKIKKKQVYADNNLKIWPLDGAMSNFASICATLRHFACFRYLPKTRKPISYPLKRSKITKKQVYTDRKFKIWPLDGITQTF